MTLEELKVEANKLGYSLIKKKPYVPIKSCPVCGKKGTSVWYDTVNKRKQRQCSSCDFEGGWTNGKSL